MGAAPRWSGVEVAVTSLSRVVWSEGMHLAQHHFQAQSRYFEDVTAFAVSRLFFKPYGVAGCDLDAEALRNGTVVLTAARGMMPDGLAFHFPDDPPPEALEIRDLFSPTHDSHLVLLAIPPFRRGGGNCSPAGNGGSPDVRFRPATARVVDEITGREERPIEVAHKNFRLILDVQATPDLVTLPLARVRRDGAGHFVYDPDYIAPCLQIGASPQLMHLLSRLIETLDAKAQALLGERRAAHGSLAEYASREVAGFWLSHAVHSSLLPLRHLLHVREVHPEQLYLELARLAGALCTFAMDSDPRTLPLYDHDALGRCFSALERHIRDHLEIVLPTRGITIPLVVTAPLYHGTTVTDPRALGRSHWYLGVRSSAGVGEVIAAVPRLVKVCSAEHIAKLVARAFPALSLEHVPSPPPEISPRIGTQYFRIGRSVRGADGTLETSPCWTLIAQTGGVGVYVPGAIPDAELDLCIVLEG
jgi:type VI secretion system protein ImpJ